jgi:hypothetical protein
MPQPDPGVHRGYRWIWAALIGVLALSLGVVFVLPQLVTEREAPVQGPVPAVRDRTPAPTVGETVALRTRAEKTLQQFLHRRAQLELLNAPLWGEPLWSKASAKANAGDRLFGERRFDAAAQAYADAVDQLEELQASRESRLREAVAAGERALDDDDAGTATTQFELALAIEPDHPQASRGLARARVRPTVIDGMQAGANAEARGDLEAARAAYGEAVALDGDYRPASAASERVSQQLIDMQFGTAMSDALQALQAGRLADAAAALEQAAALKPDDSAVADNRRRLVQARQQQRLDSLRRAAASKAGDEDWQGAIELYRKGLAVDPGAAFARDGLAHAQDRARLHQQFDHYLTDPARLYSAKPLANAEQLLSMAGNAPADEPHLADKIAALKRHVADARAPLPVTLRSDGETEVAIYHVGRLGRFLDHELQLRPGTYTVVGTRPGYRDVRKVLTLQPGTTPPPVDIRCEEPV